MSGTIQGTFGWDNTPVIQGMREAESVVARGSANMQDKFLSIFKRSPHMRAERALGGALQAFAAGDIAAGIQGITHRMTGLGLVAGVAIGAGVEIFRHFKEQIDQTREAADALESDLRKPIQLLTGGSSEGIEKALQVREKHAADLTSKLDSKMGSQFAEAGKDWAKTVFPFFFGSDTKSTGDERLNQDKMLNREGADRKTLLQAQADIASKLVQLKAQELERDEHAAKLERIRYEYEQQRVELQKSGFSGNALLEQQETIAKTADLARNQENKRFDLKEKSLAIEEKMAALIHRGLSPADQKKVRAGMELNSLDQQLAGETNPERRRALTLERLNKQNELRAIGAGQSDAGPEWGSIARRNAETNDPNAWGSLGYTAANRGEGPAATAENKNAEVVSAIKETNDLIKQALL